MADSVADLLKTFDASAGPLRASYAQQAAQGPTGIFANVDPVMLGLAQGFLSPTKTGGFGESIGTALAGAQGPLEAMRKRQLSAQEKMMELDLARAKLAMEAPYWARRGMQDGSLSASQNRLYLEGKIAMIENALGDPKALEKLGFRDNEEAEAALSRFQQEYLNYGSPIIKAPAKDDKTAKSGDGEKPTEKPTEEKKVEKSPAPSGGSFIGALTGQNRKPPKEFPNAILAPDGEFYMPDPNRPGKYLKVQQ